MIAAQRPTVTDQDRLDAALLVAERLRDQLRRINGRDWSHYMDSAGRIRSERRGR